MKIEISSGPKERVVRPSDLLVGEGLVFNGGNKVVRLGADLYIKTYAASYFTPPIFCTKADQCGTDSGVPLPVGTTITITL